MGIIAVYVTHETKEDAERFSRHLIDKKLAACSNIFPVQSLYNWQGRFENTPEYISILKTRKECWEKLVSEAEKIHPYETPCIVKYEVSANPEYEKWVFSQTGCP